jgi:dephospho-CoA kinase
MLIGITGTIGAGKGTVAEYLAQKGYRHISVSGFLRKEVKGRGKLGTRVNLRDSGNEYRAKSPHALIEAVLADINSAKENIVVEALHTVSEVEYMKNLGGKIFSVDAPFKIRYDRVRKRGDGKDDVLLEEFLDEDHRQMASDDPNQNNLSDAIAAADFHIKNEGPSEKLFRKIDAILVKIT